MNEGLDRAALHLRELILARAPLSVSSVVRADRANRSPFIPSFILTALQQISILRPSIAEDLRAPRRVLKDLIAQSVEADGMIRFFGPGDPIDPDCDTIACAAVALAGEGLEVVQLIRALDRFRNLNGLYASYVSADGQKYTWIEDGGRVVQGIDRTVQANVLFARSSVGHGSPTLIAYLTHDLATLNPLAGSRDYPYPTAYPYCALRALGAVRVFNTHNTFNHLVRRFKEASDAWGPLSLSHVLSILTRREMPIELAKANAQALWRIQNADGGWDHEPFFVGGFGSETLSTAEALLALCRHQMRKFRH